MTTCFICDSNTTIPNWYKHKYGVICGKCYKKMWRKKNPEKVKECNDRNNPVYNKRVIKFTPIGKRILLKFNPRKGICEWCNRKIGEGIKRTNLHHTKYHNDDILKDTIELCVSCHNKTKIRSVIGTFKKEYIVH